MFIRKYHCKKRKNTLVEFKCQDCNEIKTITSSVYKTKQDQRCRECYLKTDLPRKHAFEVQRKRWENDDRTIPINVILETKHLGIQKVKTFWNREKHRTMVLFICPTCKEEKQTAKFKFTSSKKNIYCQKCYLDSPERYATTKEMLKHRVIPTGSDSVHWTGTRWKTKNCKCGKEFQAEKRYNGINDYAVYCSRDCKNRFQISSHPKPIPYKEYKLKSSWELAFAKYLDNSDFEWTYEPMSFPTPYGYYTPDFYIEELDIFIEVKGRWRDDSKKKFDYLSKLKTIILADKKWLIEHGFILLKDGKMEAPSNTIRFKAA